MKLLSLPGCQYLPLQGDVLYYDRLFKATE
jgi:hypothetical protein